MDAEGIGVVNEVPIFPLGTVLFPGVILPLHIFEDRYKAMMRYAIENRGQFGLSYRDDAAVGKDTPPQVGSVGCVAKINAVMPLEGGRMNVLSTGIIRYRVTEVKQHTPFVIAKIEPFGDDPEPESDLSQLFKDAREVTGKYLEALQELNDSAGKGELDLPEEAEAYSLFVASALPVENSAKQQLLEMTSTKLRLRRLAHYFNSSLDGLGGRLQKHEAAKSNGHGKLKLDS